MQQKINKNFLRLFTMFIYNTQTTNQFSRLKTTRIRARLECGLQCYNALMLQKQRTN